MKLCECGCGQDAPIATKNNTAKGHVKGQPMRFVTQHHRRKSPVDYVVNERGCWIWQLGTFGTGYGQVNRGGRSVTAHRYYYEKRHGPVPDGLVLDHLCRTALCVNPDHLEPVSQGENVRRGATTKLTAAEVDAIKGSAESRGVLADRFNVSAAYITDIRQGRRRAAMQAQERAA